MFSGSHKIVTQSIGFRLLKSIVFAYALWEILMVSIQGFQSYQEKKIALRKELINVSVMTASEMTQLFENDDLDGLTRLINEIKGNLNVQRVSIHSLEHPDWQTRFNGGVTKVGTEEWVSYSWDVLSRKEKPSKLLGSVSLYGKLESVFWG